MGQDLKPAFYTPRIRNTSDLDSIGWNFSGFEMGQHGAGEIDSANPAYKGRIRREFNQAAFLAAC